MGIFDIDSGTDNHLLNEQFHVFSKSPASVATALGDASNRSGHTVTASDVWGQEIPAFFYAKTQAVADSYKALAKTNDLCRIGNSVAIFENGNWVVKYNSYTDIPDGHKFKNAAGDDVIRFHKNRLAYNLNLDNNAADDGLNTTAKIQGWDEENGKVYDYVATAPKFVTQFVTSTDKIVDGIPSKGFGPFVMAGTTTGDITKVLPEGTSDANHYIANSFAGIIQFNKARTDAIYVHAFEYCGKTLKSAYSDIVELDEKISKISVTASGGIQDASTDAKTAGFSVTTETRTNSEGKEETIPVFDIETGSVTTDETKLVTGGAVKTYVDTTALAEGGSISQKITSAINALGDVAVKGDIKISEIKVKSGSTTTTLTPDDNKSVTVEIPEVQAATTDVAGVVTISDNDAIAITETSSTAAATVAAVAATRSAIAEEMGALAGTISTLEGTVSGVKTTAESAIQTVKVNNTALTKSGTEVDITAIVGVDETVANGIKVTKTSDNKVKISVTPASYTSSNKTWTNDAYFAKASDIATAISDAVDAIVIPPITLSGNAGNVGFRIDRTNNDNEHYIDLATAAYTPASATGEIGNWTDASKGYLVTGATVAAAIGDVNAKVDALHQTPQFSVVVVAGVAEGTDWKTAVDGGVKENVIYLVQDTDAADGSYIEYIAYKSGESIVTEQIGSTKIDLSGYAKSVKINSSTYPATADNEGALDLGTVVTKTYGSNDNTKENYPDNSGSIQAYIGDGMLYLGIASATSNKMGVSKLHTGDLSTTISTVTDTAVSVASAQAMYGKLAALANSKLDQIKGGDYLGLAALAVESGNTINPSCITPSINERLPKLITSVIGNLMFSSGGPVIPIEPEKIYSKEGSSNYFAEGSNLVTWCADLPGVESGSYMFAASSSLTSFCGDLSSLTNGYSMFGNCFALTSFCGDLSSLTDGENMFEDCKLDAESLECIADTLPTVSSGIIEIGYKCSAAAAQAAYATITGKGWSCVMTYNA